MTYFHRLFRTIDNVLCDWLKGSGSALLYLHPLVLITCAGSTKFARQWTTPFRFPPECIIDQGCESKITSSNKIVPMFWCCECYFYLKCWNSLVSVRIIANQSRKKSYFISRQKITINQFKTSPNNCIWSEHQSWDQSMPGLVTHWVLLLRLDWSELSCWPILGVLGGTKNGTWGAKIKILRLLFNTNTPPKTPI